MTRWHSIVSSIHVALSSKASLKDISFRSTLFPFLWPFAFPFLVDYDDDTKKFTKESFIHLSFFIFIHPVERKVRNWLLFKFPAPRSKHSLSAHSNPFNLTWKRIKRWNRKRLLFVNCWWSRAPTPSHTGQRDVLIHQVYFIRKSLSRKQKPTIIHTLIIIFFLNLFSNAPFNAIKAFQFSAFAFSFYFSIVSDAKTMWSCCS